MMLQGEESIMGYRNSSDRLKTQYENDLAAIIEDARGNIIAFSTLWETESPDWLELGSIWTHPDYRGRGLASRVFEACVRKYKQKNLKVFTITHNSRIVHLLKKYGWQERGTLTWDKVPFSVTCGPCDRIHENFKGTCVFKAVTSECRLFHD
ncbi:MAG: GNAT family N-acetyltransferase [Parcubacteria group bacterium]